jgi:hypothetical protein
MPDYTITVKVYASESNFPATGEVGKYYFAGTLSDYENDLGTVKQWDPNNSTYVAISIPRPHKPPPIP